MLKRLSIKNVALIESAEIDFEKGFNVLSGETGAGKSVVLDSLNFVLGAKAEKSMIRSGAEECLVSAEFEIDNSETVYQVLDEFGFEKEDILIPFARYLFFFSIYKSLTSANGTLLIKYLYLALNSLVCLISFHK